MILSNGLRNSYNYNKKYLQKMLKDNGYKLYDGTTGPYKYVGDMFKSWTRDRLIRELMSF
jgi:ClpP class serine protease